MAKNVISTKDAGDPFAKAEAREFGYNYCRAKASGGIFCRTQAQGEKREECRSGDHIPVD